MGLIRAAVSAATGVLGDTWKEVFVCDSMSANTIMTKGKKQTSWTSSNKFGHDNIITNGSGIVVADGQCMIIVDNGEIVEICSEPGMFTYDSSTEPSIFCGNLKKGILDSFEKFKIRFTMGGDAGHDQRVYYFNTKEMTDNKFGTPNPIPFRVVDANIGLDVDVQLRCSGVYSWRLADPILFYKNVAGNVKDSYTVEEITPQLKTEFISGLQPSIAKLSELGLRPNALPAHVDELCKFMNDALTEKWGQLRGFEVVSIAMNPITLTEEDSEMIKSAQKAGMMRDPNMAAAVLTEAQASAMKDAANNSAGAMTGFMGVGMAMNAGGNAQGLFEIGQQKKAEQEAPKEGWTCACGTVNTGNFCSNCGEKKPEEAAGKFCSNCGTKLDADAKFCSNCGTKVE